MNGDSIGEGPFSLTRCFAWPLASVMTSIRPSVAR